MIGENPIGIPDNIFPYLTKVAFGNLKQLKIFGSDWPTIDGTGVRDYIHIMDLASAHVNAVDFLNKKNIFDVFNIGTGYGISVFEFIKSFEEVCGLKVPFKVSSRRLGDPSCCYADPTKAKKFLNWRAKRDLKEMCLSAWNFSNSSEIL